MSLQIQQNFEYQDNDWWKWWVWIDGPDEELDDLDYVVYTLHHTFANPIRKVDDRKSRFKLKTSGWGVFKLYATLVHKDGRETELCHDLRLEYPDGTPNTA
jgi:transcription initiation factor IIF auxiliary subunit